MQTVSKLCCSFSYELTFAFSQLSMKRCSCAGLAHYSNAYGLKNSKFLCIITVLLFSYCVASGHCQVTEDKRSQVHVSLHASTNDAAKNSDFSKSCTEFQ